MPIAHEKLPSIEYESRAPRGISERRTRQALASAAVFSALLCIAAGGTAVFTFRCTRGSCCSSRVHCASNLRQIGQSIQIYANEHRGALPPSLDEVLIDTDLTAEVFVCPTSNDMRTTGPTTQAVLQQFRQPGFCSYVYVRPAPGMHSSTMTSSHILAYEPLSNHAGDGMNVLYGDIHIEWIPKSDVAHVVAELQAGHNPPRPPATQSTLFEVKLHSGDE